MMAQINNLYYFNQQRTTQQAPKSSDRNIIETAWIMMLPQLLWRDVVGCGTGCQ
jgi:hypothetical protein